MLQSMWSQRIGHNLVTEQQQEVYIIEMSPTADLVQPSCLQL